MKQVSQCLCPFLFGYFFQNLCERHPVIFMRPGESDDTMHMQPRVLCPSEDGYKVKKQGKKFSFNDSRGLESKIADIIFEHAQLDNSNKLCDMSVDDVIKNALNRNNIEKNISEEVDGIESGNDDNITNNPQKLEESFSASHKENVKNTSRTGMPESVCNPSGEISCVLKVKPSPPTYSSRSQPMDLSIGPIDNPDPQRASKESMDTESPKLINYYKPFNERPSPRVSPKPMFEKNRAQHKSGSSLGAVGIRPETEYLQISSQIINPHGLRRLKPELYSTHAMTNEAIRQVRQQNKLSGSRENMDGMDAHRSLSPSSTSRAYTIATPSLAISIPTADDDSDRESGVSLNRTENENGNMTSKQIRELNIRDAQIDEIASMLGEAIIGPDARNEDRRFTPQKQKKTVRIKED